MSAHPAPGGWAAGELQDAGDVEFALLAAERAGRPHERFIAAHLAALRVAAAVMAERRPRLRSRRSVWDVLAEVAPELGEWAAYFGVLQPKRQAVQAGAVALVSAREADDLVRDVRAFRDAARVAVLRRGSA